MVGKAKTEKEMGFSRFQEVYPISEPYAYAAVVREPNTQKISYEVIEPTLLEREKTQLEDLKDILMAEIDVNLKDLKTRERAKEYLQSKVQETIRDYNLKIATESIDKFMYFITRDFIGYGRIDPFMKDHLIEDISADGVNIPIYVWHRRYESLPTNIRFRDGNELNSFIVRLAYLAKKNVSIANPMLDASLPDGSRIQLTYGNEITKRGSTFTIRRFRADPLTISDLISFNTLSLDMAAYFWFVIENRISVLVAGGVASGKTTTLNCLSMFIKPEYKIVSVEDTAELNLPHENWIPSVVRSGFSPGQRGVSPINLFDLLKAAVRQRPDYIIVGEVRGEEAYTLFQAMATGHLGMSTIHAESVEAAISRLESEPMNVPRSFLSMIDVVMIQGRTEINGKPARRAFWVKEVLNLDPSKTELVTNDVYRWDAKHDIFSYSGQSHILKEIMEKRGLDSKEIEEELHRRKTVLEWMVKKQTRKYTEVGDVIREYSVNPAQVYRKARMKAH